MISGKYISTVEEAVEICKNFNVEIPATNETLFDVADGLFLAVVQGVQYGCEKISGHPIVIDPKGCSLPYDPLGAKSFKWKNIIFK